MGWLTAGGDGVQRSPTMAPILGLRELEPDRIRWLLGVAAEIGDRPDRVSSDCSSRTLGLVFGSPEPLTRAAFEVGVRQLGGSAVHFSSADLGTAAAGPTARDSSVDRTPGSVGGSDLAALGYDLSGPFDALVVRMHEHGQLSRFVEGVTVPVISAGSDIEDPCAALGDLHAAKDRLGSLQGRKLAVVSSIDGRVRSLAYGAAALGMDVVFAPGRHARDAPDGGSAGPGAEIVAVAQEIGSRSGARVEAVTDPLAALRDADVVFADAPLDPGSAEEASSALGLGDAGLGHPPVGDGRLHICKVLILFVLDLI